MTPFVCSHAYRVQSHQNEWIWFLKCIYNNATYINKYLPTYYFTKFFMHQNKHPDSSFRLFLWMTNIPDQVIYLYTETLHLKSTNITSEDNYWENDPICLKLALRVSFEKGFNSLIVRIGLLWPLFQRDMIVDASFWKPYYFNDSTSLLSIYKWKKM